MGKYINIGNAEFESVRKDEYVDKSMLIAYVNKVLGTQRKFLCVTRARRFGKSIAAKMLNAYYDESVNSHALFHDLNIAKDPSYEPHRNKYPVIYLDMASFMTRRDVPTNRILDVINGELLAEIDRTYPGIDYHGSNDVLDKLYAVVGQTHKPFVMIMDEWDAICRDENDPDLMQEYVNWLRHLFKSNLADHIFAGVYMTGILPIKQYKTQSALNNFEEFSMINPGPLAGYFGFTKQEVAVLAKEHKMDTEEIKAWYDGYQIGTIGEIYNPYSVMRAVQRQSIESYWAATSTYEGLKDYITMNFEGLRDSVVSLLVGNSEPVDVLRFTNDMHSVNSKDAVLTLLIHLGYLSYNRAESSCCIPNQEVRQEFESTIQATDWSGLAEAVRNSAQLLRDTLAGNSEAVAKAIESVHQNNTSILQYNDENALSYVVSLAYQAGQLYYHFVRELPTGKGFADIVMLPRIGVNKPAIVVELKYDKSANAAIDQIKTKGYTQSLRDYVGDVILVGINYDPRTKHHTCLIERGDGSIVEGGKSATGQVTGQVQKLLLTLKDATMKRDELMSVMGMNSRWYFYEGYLNPAINAGYVAKTLPDKPNSSKQRYYLTPKGIELLKQLNAN